VGAAQSYLFDESGHALERCWLWRAVQNGPWVCEPGVSQQYIWMGDIPVAAILANRHFDGEGYLISDEPEAIFYIHTDHLNTPPRLTVPSEPNNPIVWRWDSDAFGVGFANPNANNSPTRQWLSMDLRFPGQLWDDETWRHYNYFRDYDPYTGHYVQS
jgi:RHS repeat-associated protein